MADAMPVAIVRGIRECGFNEAWLQDQIYDDPSCLAACLRLRDLSTVMKERHQEEGGRLDLLLKNPDDDTMYEVEVMLGKTDESHIVRTIEYWDRERRKWPKRQHIAVLIAETITARFFNVIHLMSWAIPMIAVPVSIVEANGQRSLHFTRVLDTYEEPEEMEARRAEVISEEYWRSKYPWTLQAAEALVQAVAPELPHVSLNYVKSFISLKVGQNNYLTLFAKASNKSVLQFRLSDEALDKARALLEGTLPYEQKGRDKVNIWVDRSLIASNPEIFRSLAKLVREFWEKD
jgi:hypothetical protein